LYNLIYKYSDDRVTCTHVSKYFCGICWESKNNVPAKTFFQYPIRTLYAENSKIHNKLHFLHQEIESKENKEHNNGKT
jgi:DUF438 domain-containing protein